MGTFTLRNGPVWGQPYGLGSPTTSRRDTVSPTRCPLHLGDDTPEARVPESGYTWKEPRLDIATPGRGRVSEPRHLEATALPAGLSRYLVPPPPAPRLVCCRGLASLHRNLSPRRPGPGW